jgi:hypothetical protein
MQDRLCSATYLSWLRSFLADMRGIAPSALVDLDAAELSEEKGISALAKFPWRRSYRVRT